MSQINIMALRHSAFYSPLLMTMAGDFLKEEGLESSYTVATADNTVVDNINQGSCDLAQSAVATGFSVLQQGGNSDVVHLTDLLDAEKNIDNTLIFRGRRQLINWVEAQ